MWGFIIFAVAFVAILTAIAIPQYLNFQKRAKEAEARTNLGSIRDCFVAYFAEANTFSLGTNVGTLAYTAGDNQGTPYGSSLTALGNNKAWDKGTAFSVLGFQADMAVFFNYSLETNDLIGDDATFTAMASALVWPTSPTSFRPLVIPV